MSLMQYQALAEPLGIVSNPAFLDKWQPRTPDKAWRLRFGGGSFNVSASPSAEIIYADKWGPRYQDSIAQKTEFQSGYNAFTELSTASVLPDKYAPVYKDSIPQKSLPPLGVYAYDFGIATKENIFPDKWLGRYSDKVVGPNIFPSGMYVYDFGIATKENIFPDKWLGRYSDRNLLARSIIETGIYSFTELTTANVPIGWYPFYDATIDKLIARPSLGQYSYDFGIATNKIIYLDKYQPRYADRTSLAKSAVQQGMLAFTELTAGIVPLGWYPFFDISAKKLILRPALGAYAYDFGIATKEIIYPDKWKPTYQDKIAQKRFVDSGHFSIALGVVVATPYGIIYYDQDSLLEYISSLS